MYDYVQFSVGFCTSLDIKKTLDCHSRESINLGSLGSLYRFRGPAYGELMPIYKDKGSSIPRQNTAQDDRFGELCYEAAKGTHCGVPPSNRISYEANRRDR